MIPLAIRTVWERALAEDDEAEDDDLALTPSQRPGYDPIVRYMLIGLFVIALTASLYLTKVIVLPVTAGLIFGLVLGPVVDRMMRFGVPQGLAAGLIVLAGIVCISLIIAIFAAPFAIWSDRLPSIVATIKGRMDDILAVARQLENATKDLSPAPETPTVAIDNTNPWVTVALTSSAAAGGLLIFVATIYFYLATRRHMKARALRMCLGKAARRSAGQFLADIEIKVASYFAVVTTINLGMGLATTLLAWGGGLPFPIFWGLLAFILNYIAFIGPIIVTALLFGAVLIEPGTPWIATWPAFGYFLVHLIEGNIVTPLMVGRRLTLSPFLVFISFIFWLWLWGPVGAILSTPLLLVIVLSIDAAATYRKMEQDGDQPAENAVAAAARTVEKLEAGPSVPAILRPQ